MDRSQALALVQHHITNQNLVKHSFAVEAIMHALAHHFGEDEELWGLTGLLHDIDYDTTKDDFSQHSLLGSQMLAGLGVDQRIVYAVKVHNEMHGDPRISLLEATMARGDRRMGKVI